MPDFLRYYLEFHPKATLEEVQAVERLAIDCGGSSDGSVIRLHGRYILVIVIDSSLTHHLVGNPAITLVSFLHKPTKFLPPGSKKPKSKSK